MAVDYSKFLEAEKDPLKREKIQMQIAAEQKRLATQNIKPATTAPKATNIAPVTPTPQTAPTQQSVTTPQVLAPQMTGRLVNFLDEAGNLQQIDESYIASGQVPKGWRQAGAVTGQDQFGTLSQQLADAQKQKSIAALEQAYKRATGSLESEKAGLEPMFGAQTRQAVAQSAMGKKSFSDFLAEKGLGGSGLSGQGEIAQNVALQSQLGGIEATKGQALSDIARRMTEAQQARDYGIAGAESESALMSAQQQLERLQQQEQRSYQEQQTKAQQDREDYLTNIGQFSQNYQKEINNLIAQGVPENDYRVMALRNARTQKLGAMAEAEQNAYVQSIKDETAKQEQAFELAKWRFNNGLPATQMDAQLLGVQVGQVSPAQSIKNAELQLAKQKESRVASKSSGGSSGSSSSTQQKSPVTLTDYEQALKRTFTENDTPETQSKKAAEFIIKNKGVLSDSIIQRLATRYNVTEQMIQDYVNMEKFNVMKNL